MGAQPPSIPAGAGILLAARARDETLRANPVASRLLAHRQPPATGSQLGAQSRGGLSRDRLVLAAVVAARRAMEARPAPASHEVTRGACAARRAVFVDIFQP